MNNSEKLLFLTIGLIALTVAGCGPAEEPEGEAAEPNVPGVCGG